MACNMLPQAVTLHTSLGDLKAEIFCEEVPRTAENFLALCASGAYDGTLFHRNIRGFMIQGGDPTGLLRLCTNCSARMHASSATLASACAGGARCT